MIVPLIIRAVAIRPATDPNGSRTTHIENRAVVLVPGPEPSLFSACLELAWLLARAGHEAGRRREADRAADRNHPVPSDAQDDLQTL